MKIWKRLCLVFRLPNCIVIAALLSTLSARAATPQYTATDLGTLGGSSSWAWGVNDNGQVVGSSTAGGIGINTAFIWDQTTGMRSLGVESGYTNSMGWAVNNYGVVVGANGTGGVNGVGNAFAWSNTTGMVQIDPVYATPTSARDINNSGTIVGFGLASDYQLHASLWSAGSSIDLGVLPGYTNSMALSINDSGQVVGFSRESNGGLYHPTVWQSGAMIDIGLLPGMSSALAFAGNNLGQVVGYSDGIGAHSFIWDSINGMRDIGSLFGTTTNASAINDLGQIVGTSGDSVFIWDAIGGMVDLNTLLEPGSGFSRLTRANGINNNGQIVGTAMFGSVEHAYLLTPTAVPLPAAAWLFGSGIFGLVGVVGKRKVA